VDAKLESIRDDYVERIARDRVKAVVESYERKRAIAEKQALCESIIAGYKARKESEDRKNLVESTMGEKISELGDKMAAMLEGTESKDSLDAKFESILDKFGKDKAAMKATEKLDAKLESILSKAVADKEADRKLAAIVESVKNPAPAAKKEGLDARLESIIADAKKKIAAAK
jgi:ABC-type enterochelin transport system substrate-binding protein